MPDDTRPLGFYGVRSGMTIHVIDTDPFSLARGGGLDDVSQVWECSFCEIRAVLRRLCTVGVVAGQLSAHPHGLYRDVA